MKKVLTIILGVIIIALGYACFNSIHGSVQFDKERKAREATIIKALMDIRTAQIAYKQQFFTHAGTFEDLREWLNNGYVKTVRKEMELTEDQLKSGMTETKAVDIINKAMKTNKWKEAEAAGLSYVKDGVRHSFTRDTLLAGAKETLFGADYDANSIGVVPGTNVEFEMDTASVITSSGYDIKIFQAQVPYTVYLSDLDSQELNNLIDIQKQLGRYEGLRVGSLTEINNNAGNWE